MWTTNVAREIVRAEGLPLLPPDTMGRDTLAIDYGTRHIESGAGGVAVLKLHKPAPRLPRSIGIVTLRDVRDMTVSFMRFMRVPFEHALGVAEQALQRTPEVLYPGEHRVVLSHELIVGRPIDAVRFLAEQLEAPEAARRSEEIAARLSKAAVKSLIADTDADVRRRLKAGQPVSRSELVILSPENWRARDRGTDFQTGHVSDYKAGDWVEVLSKEQQAQLNVVIAAAGRHLV